MTTPTSSYAALYNAILSFMTSPTIDATALQAKAAQLATAIDNHLADAISKTTGTSTVAPGIAVQTEPTTGTGVTDSPGTATISPGGLSTN